MHFYKKTKNKFASCIKTAIDKFEHNDNSQKIFFIFTNGFDEEFVLHEQWKKIIFNNTNNSFAFIFSKSDSISKEHYNSLTTMWREFGDFCKSNSLRVGWIETDKNVLGSNNIDNNYIKVITEAILRQKKENNKEETKTSLFKIDELKNMSLKDNIDNLQKIIDDGNKFLKSFDKDAYFEKIKLPIIQETAKKIEQRELKDISKNIGKIMTVDKSNDEIISNIRELMKTFKIKKEKINLPLLEIIFKPNLPTQTVLTDVGTHIDVNELIKYFLNPTPNPRIYRELGDGFVKNYGITVVIDSSASCFSTLSNQHTLCTIQMILSAFASIDLPCFDLIITGDPHPYIICSEKNTLDILSEKSHIWPILFELLSRSIKDADLASAIRAAYNLHNSRKSEHPDFLFVITDGLFSLSDRERIIKNVIFCISKGLNVFGIGVGISPFGIKELFPNIIYSFNPEKLIEGISSVFSGVSSGNKKMDPMLSEFKFKIDKNLIKDSHINPKYKNLKDLLSKIVIYKSAFDWIPDEIPPNAKDKDVHNSGMYEKDFFKGQKLLIVMPYTCEMNSKENKYLSDKYVNQSVGSNECIQSSIDYYGIKCEVVKNYKDAIDRLTSRYNNKYCEYYACIIMSGEPYAELPNPNDNPHLFGQFINVIKQFWENGGAIGLFADNAPYNYQANILIGKLFPNSNFRIAGNHPGEKKMKGDQSGQLKKNATFNRKFILTSSYERTKISESLYEIYEGKTVSYFVEKPNDDDLLYYGKNEELKMIKDPKKLEPFIPFSKDSDGGFNSAFYASDDEKGDICIDCSYTKFFLEMGTQGTPRYIQNIVSWFGAPEKHIQKDGYKDGSEYRPKAVQININWNDKWNGFKIRPGPQNMRTLFAVDCSGSISCRSVKTAYFNKLRALRKEYYKSERGDKFYTWGSEKHYLTEKQMDDFISKEDGNEGTYSYLIAEIGKENKDKNFQHLIIVTDGDVSNYQIDECDRLVKEYDLHYSFVSTYIIGSGGNESVGCPFSRDCPGITYKIDKDGNETKQASLSKEELEAFNNIDNIESLDEFNKKYKLLYNAFRAKCLGKEKNEELKDKLNKLKSRTNGQGNDFDQKFNELFKMADGSLRNINSIVPTSTAG